jgi:predicted dehydrogenase
MTPLKVGLIGSGGISRAHMPAFLERKDDVTLTAVCDVREDAALAYAKDAGLDSGAAYTDIESFLRNADIEAVDICTTHNTHHDLAVAAIQAGKHVLLEKPMATSIAESRNIVEEAEKAGVTFMVAQMLRFLPHYQQVRRIIESGELGEIWAARADSFFGAAISGPGTVMTNDWWGFDREICGGGALMMVATHQLDLLRYFIGDVRRVTAKWWTDNPVLKNGAEDRVISTLEFENGAIGTSITSYSTRTPWHYQTLLLGEEGTIYTAPPEGGDVVAQHHAPALIASKTRDGEAGWRMAESFEPITNHMDGLVSEDNPFMNEIVHFARSIRNDVEPLSSGRQNFNTMEVVHGIYESAATGQTVELPGF